DRLVANFLVQMYGRCGSLEDARKFFHRMPSRDCVSWTSMVGEFAQFGECERAMEVLQAMAMEGVRWSFCGQPLTSALVACSNTGMIGEARVLLLAGSSDHGLDPWREHYFYIIDVLGRAGLITSARDLVASMQVAADDPVW
ncbi:hypothetical protein SELMODRAFT_72499, partial [Selaginella moellendorffii]